MAIHHFFQSIHDKVRELFGSNRILENIVVMKVAIISIALLLII